MPMKLEGPRDFIKSIIAERLIIHWQHIEIEKKGKNMKVTFCCSTDPAFKQVVKARGHENGKCQYEEEV